MLLEAVLIDTSPLIKEVGNIFLVEIVIEDYVSFDGVGPTIDAGFAWTSLDWLISTTIQPDVKRCPRFLSRDCVGIDQKGQAFFADCEIIEKRFSGIRVLSPLNFHIKSFCYQKVHKIKNIRYWSCMDKCELFRVPIVYCFAQMLYALDWTNIRLRNEVRLPTMIFTQ